MESLRELYRIGRGPSSSHTRGPQRAAELFLSRYPEAASYKVILYGSLAKTGKGHLTDKAINDVFGQRSFLLYFDRDTTDLPHPNTMDFYAYDADGHEIAMSRIMSVGGGKIEVCGEAPVEPANVYELESFAEIKKYCQLTHKRLWQYVVEVEGPEILFYLERCWNVMKNSIFDGLDAEGTLPGGLSVQRRARDLFLHHHMDESPETKTSRTICAYAFAVSEQNASGGLVVTAPTCGSCGVLPALMLYMQNKRHYGDDEIVRALATGGVIGNLIKTNASISGAECGCQAEIGSACCMGAAALGELFGMNLDQIEYAAEISMEHTLGLTCDPICGLVQIPCIERNAVAAMRAMDSATLANFLTNTRKISFDMIVQTMYETGVDLSGKYRETAEGGLAKLYK